MLIKQQVEDILSVIRSTEGAEEKLKLEENYSYGSLKKS